MPRHTDTRRFQQLPSEEKLLLMRDQLASYREREALALRMSATTFNTVLGLQWPAADALEDLISQGLRLELERTEAMARALTLDDLAMLFGLPKLEGTPDA